MKVIKEMKLWKCNSFNFWMYWFSCKCFYFSGNLSKKEVTHIFHWSFSAKPKLVISSTISYFSEKKVGSFSSILWENVMFQFRISFWQKKIKRKYFDIVRIVIYLLRYLRIGARLIPFVRRKAEHFEINFWQKKGHSKLAP